MPRRTRKYEGERVFRIPESQLERLGTWIFEIDTKVASKQIETGKGMAGSDLSSERLREIRESIERGKPFPDYGMIGGAYEYSFSPNSVGIVINVKNTVSGDTIDLTEYEGW